MSSPAPSRPELVVAAMAAAGVPRAQRDTFYRAVERRDGLARGEIVDEMINCGLDTDARLTVMTQLQDGLPAVPVPMPHASATAATHHEARCPLCPANCVGLTCALCVATAAGHSLRRLAGDHTPQQGR